MPEIPVGIASDDPSPAEVTQVVRMS
jgi:hypothetical protein